MDQAIEQAVRVVLDRAEKSAQEAAKQMKLAASLVELDGGYHINVAAACDKLEAAIEEIARSAVSLAMFAVAPMPSLYDALKRAAGTTTQLYLAVQRKSGDIQRRHFTIEQLTDRTVTAYNIERGHLEVIPLERIEGLLGAEWSAEVTDVRRWGQVIE